MRFANIFFGLIVAVFMAACTTPSERINNTIHEKDKSFINSYIDYKYDNSKSYFYVIEGANPLADATLRNIALEYANAAGMAAYSREMAYSVRNTYDKNFKLAPNWYEEEKRYKREAENYEAQAKELEQELKNIIQSQNFTISEGGIWVYHKLSYKEYLYKCYAGPYKKEWIYLYSENGEQEIWSQPVQFSESQLTAILNMTGTQFTVQSSHDYKMRN